MTLDCRDISKCTFRGEYKRCCTASFHEQALLHGLLPRLAHCSVAHQIAEVQRATPQLLEQHNEGLHESYLQLMIRLIVD